MIVTAIPQLTFHQKEYCVLEELVNDMGLYWKEGKEFLFEGALRAHIRKIDLSLSNACVSAEKEYSANPQDGDRIFLKWLCRYPEIRGLYWQGKNYGDIKALSAALSIHQYDGVDILFLEMLGGQILSEFLKNNGGDRSLIENVKYLEKSFNKLKSNNLKKNAIPMLEVFLSGRKYFIFDGQKMNSPADLAKCLQTYADESKSVLSKKVQSLFFDDSHFDPYFEAWIIMHGFQHELTLWKGRFQEEIP